MSTAQLELWTVGHSTRALDAFLELLANHRIECLVDVRRFPTSRRFPHFKKRALADAHELSENARVLDDGSVIYPAAADDHPSLFALG